jgi:STE24 endopeptidase
VVAHELAHVHYRDVPTACCGSALVAPAGMFAVAQMTRRLAGGRDAALVPALALSLAIIVPVITAISNQLSREVEARADSYALELTGEPQAFIAFDRRIACAQRLGPRIRPAGAPRWLATHRHRSSGSAWASPNSVEAGLVK